MRLAAPVALLLVSAAAHAERRWSVEPGQTLVAVDAQQFSAFSHGLSGALEERDDGAVRLVLRIPLDSLTTGDASQDQSVPRQGEMVLDLTGRPSGDENIDFEGTISVREVAQPVRIRLGVVRSEAVIYGHAVLSVHLRELGVKVPVTARDLARIEVDAALRRDRAVASQG
jgi:polyisoprenoid-binding protein YceI